MYREVGGEGSLSCTCFHKIIACGARRALREPSKCAPQARPAKGTTRKVQGLGDFLPFVLEVDGIKKKQTPRFDAFDAYSSDEITALCALSVFIDHGLSSPIPADPHSSGARSFVGVL